MPYDELQVCPLPAPFRPRIHVPRAIDRAGFDNVVVKFDQGRHEDMTSTLMHRRVGRGRLRLYKVTQQIDE